MADRLTPTQRSEVMRAVARRDTAPEIALRSSVWGHGLRYRLNRKVAGCHPDLVFLGARVAVFVDGCFWHGCPRHYTAPVGNAGFWESKLHRNRERDRRNDRDLREEGWTVLRFWECQVGDELVRVVEEVKKAVA